MSAYLAGQLAPWPTKERLATILQDAGLRVVVGKFAVRIEDGSHFVFQNYGGDFGEPVIDADAASCGELQALAMRVSEALARAQIRHRFEVYYEDDRLAAYLHWQWPQQDPAAPSG